VSFVLLVFVLFPIGDYQECVTTRYKGRAKSPRKSTGKGPALLPCRSSISLDFRYCNYRNCRNWQSLARCIAAEYPGKHDFPLEIGRRRRWVVSHGRF